jgi:hypothetical protein
MLSKRDLNSFNELRDFFRVKTQETPFESISDSDFQLEIEDFLNRILHRLNNYVPPVPPVPPVIKQKFVVNGTLPVSYGTISLDPTGHDAWSDGQTTKNAGILSELFVINDRVFGNTTTNQPFTHAGDFSGTYEMMPLDVYLALRYQATTIVTAV